MRSKTSNLNSLYEIMSHRFTWLRYPKDLLSKTYNLIHVCNAIISNYSNEYTSASLKGCRSSNNPRFNIWILLERLEMVEQVRLRLCLFFGWIEKAKYFSFFYSAIFGFFYSAKSTLMILSNIIKVNLLSISLL